MDGDTSRWNTDLIYQIFRIEEAGLVDQMPTSLYGYGDQQIWWYSKDENFTVRSAYFL